jgi:hypothetical protein
MATDGQPDRTERRRPPPPEQSAGLTEWMRATAGLRPGSFPEGAFDRGVFNQAREWLAEVRAEPSTGLLSDRGVAELVIAHALMRIRSLEEQCSWLRDRMVDDERAPQVWQGA